MTSALSQEIDIKDLPERHRVWLNEEVFYIITPSERDVFLRLKTNQERDLFIEAFWRQRDPTEGTPRNEFREEHYRRFHHANRRFLGSGKPGWKTDRGKVYIILGEPKDVRIFFGTDAYYPAESWFYQGIDEFGLPQAFSLLFYQRGRIGEYRLYDPAGDGPWSLMSNYQGNPGDYRESFYHLDRIEPELARLSVSLIPGESILNYPSLSSASLIRNIDTVAIKKIKDTYAEKFIRYKDIVEVEYSTNYMDSDAEVQLIQNQSGIHYVHFAIEPSNLSMGSFQNKIYTNLEFNGIVTDKQGTLVFQFEKAIPLNFTDEQFQTMRTRPFSFTDMFPIIPGDYTFSLILKNSVSKEFTSFDVDIFLPPQSEMPEMSALFLGFNVSRPTTARDLQKPFVVEDVQLYSQAKKTFLNKDNLYIFFQLKSLPDRVWAKGSLKYQIFREDLESSSVTHPLGKYQGRLNVIEVFPLGKFVPGYYKIKVTLLDETGIEIANQQEYFEISPVSSVPRPWVIAKAMIEPGEAHNNYMLGRQWLNKKDYENARVWLAKAFNSNPDQLIYGQSLAEANFHSQKYDDALDILLSLSDKGKADYDFILLLGRTYQALGDYANAVQIFDEAVLQFGVSVGLLNALGECHYRLGNSNEALATLEKSLEIDPGQDDIKKLINSIKN
jgi:GWxTD domain-containing protein